MAKKKSSFVKKVIISLLSITLITAGIGGYFAYKLIYQSNVNLGDKKSQIIYIPTGSTFEDVIKILGKNNILTSRSSFEYLAEKKNYKKHVKPGKYRILANMSNNKLINLLRAGIQEEVAINFNGIRSKKQMVDRVCIRIEADSTELLEALDNNEYLQKYGFNSKNSLGMFISNTYQFYWNTSADQFLDKIYAEYIKIWTEERKQKAKSVGLSQSDVIILASIVQAEQCCDYEEKRKIASLYMNRLKKGMPLQSDPTVIFAIGDFTIKRLSYEQTRLNLEYNTYVNKGLPPGPIGFVTVSSIDAVLNQEQSDYVYMCAKEDLSGKHYFSKNYEQHCGYAKKYRQTMDKLNIH